MKYRTPYITSTIALAVLAGYVNASQANCEERATNMADIRACLGEQQEDKVEAAYQTTYTYVKSHNKDAANFLEAAQKTWKEFSEKSCDYTVAARQTSKLANDARANCMAAFSNARVKVLNSYRKEFGNAP